jgi:hypothetical protein
MLGASGEQPEAFRRYANQHRGIKADISAEERSGTGKESAMKTALFPFVVLIHAFSMLLGMASLSFLVFTERLSTFLILVLLSLTASLAAPSSKLALCIARTAPRKRRKR